MFDIPAAFPVRRSRINGEFHGFDEDILFRLMDSTSWLQAEYKYWYHYAHSPQVEIIRDGGTFRLRVSGQTESVAVRQVYDVIESHIAEAFEGWQGESEYKLLNGQVWRQAVYKYEYQYKYRPEVVIYSGSAGMIMDVEGCRAVVRRVR